MAIKHGMKNDGAPFNEDGKLVNDDKSTKGEGLGYCTCGAHSDPLPDRASRRRWHAWHKENLPTEPTLDEELASLVDAGEDLIGDADEGDDLIGADKVTAAVPFTTELAGIFWGICGNAGGKKVLAAYHPDVEVKADSPNKQLLLTGEQASVDAATITVEMYWAHAAEDFKAWKKNTPAYKDRDQTDPAQRRIGHQLTKGFFTDYAADYAAGKVTT